MRITSVSVVLLAVVGCASSADDTGSGASDLTSAFMPDQGVYVAQTLETGNTCGTSVFPEIIFVNDVTKDGYTFTLPSGHDNKVYHFTAHLFGHTGPQQQELRLPGGGDTTVVIEDDMQAAWATPTSFNGRTLSTFRCEGDDCTKHGIFGQGPFPASMPCSVSRVAVYSIARCDKYPFRRYYGGLGDGRLRQLGKDAGRGGARDA